MTALANASQNATSSRRRSVHQRSLPHCLLQAWVRSITHRAGLDRGRDASGSDLADHPRLG
jgi:hypothetical protein